jgi:hypothetical protein
MWFLDLRNVESKDRDLFALAGATFHSYPPTLWQTRIRSGVSIPPFPGCSKLPSIPMPR